jgi:hypothetical protein
MTSLPDLITEMSPATKVRLSDNRLCTLSSDLEAWATGKDPAWKTAQTCGAGVRPGATRASGPLLRAFSENDVISLDFPGLGNRQGTYEIFLRDASGRTVFRRTVADVSGTLEIPRAGAGHAAGFLWAELRSGAASLAAVPVLPW